MPAISVLIPCYNVAATVDETLDSLAAQTLADFEVVLVEDGSTDATLSHLETWAQRDRRFRVLACPHRGIIPALNAGLEACSSEIIARLDADDRAVPQRLERQVAMLAGHPEVALVTSLVKGFPAGDLGGEFRAYIDWLNGLQGDEDIRHHLFVHSPFAHPSVAYRREWVRRVGGYQDHGWAEDYDLWVRLYLAGATFGKIAEVLLEWRDHPQRLTHTDGRYSPQSDLRLKAHYLAQGSLSEGRPLVIWGAGELARQLQEQLERLGVVVITDSPIELALANHRERTGFAIDQSLHRLPIEVGRPVLVLVAETDPNEKARILQDLDSASLRQGKDWILVG